MKKWARIRRCPIHNSEIYKSSNGNLIRVDTLDQAPSEVYPNTTMISGVYKCCLDFDDLEAYTLTAMGATQAPSESHQR